MLRAVLDTNVLVAGMRSVRGASFELLRLLDTKIWAVVLSNTLLTEYQEVLHREQPALPYSHQEIEKALDNLCVRAEQWHLRNRWLPMLPDPDDEAMVHLAVESGADYIVTHNVRHVEPARELGVRVVTPGEFLRKLRKEL